MISLRNDIIEYIRKTYQCEIEYPWILLLDKEVNQSDDFNPFHRGC